MFCIVFPVPVSGTVIKELDFIPWCFEIYTGRFVSAHLVLNDNHSLTKN